jgi:hypothetical protein
MGSFNAVGEKKQRVPGNLSAALEEFGASFFEATEIEKIDFVKFKNQGNLPTVFFMLNKSLDGIIENLEKLMHSMGGRAR